jgi:hypothetical protein
MTAPRSTERGQSDHNPRKQSAESLQNAYSIDKREDRSMTPDLKKPSCWRPLQRAPEDAHHQPDDDTPKPPELNALSSPQARRAWREGAL